MKSKKRLFFLVLGLVMIAVGMSILSVYGYRKISREIRRHKLLAENVVIEIPELKIKAPVLEGTDNKVLSVAVGHFEDTGAVGSGNYCIAGHSSVIYKEYFNNIKNVKTGMKINLYDKNKNCFEYSVTEYFIVNPSDTWILDDYGDDRVTIVTCTDDGTQRQIVVGIKN